VNRLVAAAQVDDAEARVGKTRGPPGKNSSGVRAPVLQLPDHAAQERNLVLSRTEFDYACYAAHTFSKITFDYEIR
jgi:hypothetical protein